MSALVTTSFVVTAVPSTARVPSAGSVTIFTLASVSPVSASAKPKSASLKVYGLSTTVVTVLWAAVGAVLGVPGAVSLTVMSVPAVREAPVLNQTLLRAVMMLASARTKEVLPTTRVRAAVAVVRSALTRISNLPLERT